MKRFLKLNIAAVGVSILLAGCANKSHSRLQNLVDKTAAKCPIKVADGITLDSIEYRNDMVTYYTSVTNGLLQLQTLKDETDMVRKLIVKAFQNHDTPEYNELEMCAEAGASIVMAFTNRQGDTFDLLIDPTEYVESNKPKTDEK